MKNFAIDTFYFSGMIIVLVGFIFTGLWVYVIDIAISTMKYKFKHK